MALVLIVRPGGLTGGREFSLPRGCARRWRSEGVRRRVRRGRSLFAANLAQLDDVEVWAYDVSQPTSTRSTRTVCDSSVRARSSAVRRRRPTRASFRSDFGIVATKAMHTEGAIAATAHAFADGAVATVQNGVGNEEVVAGHVGRADPGTTFPAGKILEPGVVQWDVKGDTTLGPFEPGPRARRGRAARGRARAAACPTSGADGAARAVAEGHLQRRDEPVARSPGSPTAASASGPTCARS